jgi:hypothetical protein
MLQLKEMSFNNEVIQSEKFKETLITNWPIAKMVLEQLVKGVKNPFLKIAIEFIVRLGDKLYEKNLEITV